MKLTFLGATHEVTGSCFLLQANGSNIVIDCGMEQGRDIFENADLPLPPADIDAVLLTHAHIDHSGKLPLLYSGGFGGNIYTTEATSDLCAIMLRDSAHIQESEAEWKSRKSKRSGGKPYTPLYTVADAEETIKKFVACPYGKQVTVADNVLVRFIDAGHLLGSSSIEVICTENGISKTIVFSGDIGNVNKPILRDPQYFTKADYVVTESTYGNRSHGESPDYISAFASAIQDTLDKGGNLVIPSFAVGRTQEILYFIRHIKDHGLVKGHDGFPVYVDSPMAVESTKVFGENWIECFDSETKELIARGINPLEFDGLNLSITSDQSKAINMDKTPKVIISASGMCEAGRIRHHLKHNLWREECTVLFVGYQSEGTLGRMLLDGADEVKLFGEKIAVKACISNIAGVSGHADNTGLIKWIDSYDPKPQRVFVVHGDNYTVEEYSARLRSEKGLTVTAPYSGESWDLLTNTMQQEGIKKMIVKAAPTPSVSPAYARLQSAGDRLMNIIRMHKNASNKDIAALADQITALCNKCDK